MAAQEKQVAKALQHLTALRWLRFDFDVAPQLEGSKARKVKAWGEARSAQPQVSVPN